MAFIHVIIPVYNAEKYLHETVDSVLSQPSDEIDIILVNDGSTDGSAALCDKLAEKDSRIHVIHQKNAGVSAARNAGIEYFLDRNGSDGYIAFLDSDDLWCPNVFTDGFIESLQADHPDIYGFSAYCANPDASRFRILSQYENRKMVFTEKYQTQFLWAEGSFAAHLYHLRLFREYPIRFVAGCRHNEDVIFSAKALFCTHSFHTADQFLYIYRMNRSSVTSTMRYHLGNACEIPDAWYQAAAFAESLPEMPGNIRAAWETFATHTSSIRCLEMIRNLAMAGYRSKEISDYFADRPYYHAIQQLSPEELAPWQRSDLLMYRSDFQAFCRKYRINHCLKAPLRSLLVLTGMMNLIDRTKYTLVLDRNAN